MKDVFAGKCVGGANHDRVTAFEEFIHASLPADYRAFLLEFNGGVPANETCQFESKTELPGGSAIDVGQFFTLNQDHAVVRNLHAEIEANVGWLGMNSICIGSDLFGNLICLDCETAHVEWLLLEGRFNLDFSRAFDLCVSFSEFLERLAPGAYSKNAV